MRKKLLAGVMKRGLFPPKINLLISSPSLCFLNRLEFY
jgi:hypothetical protein